MTRHSQNAVEEAARQAFNEPFVVVAPSCADSWAVHVAQGHYDPVSVSITASADPSPPRDVTVAVTLSALARSAADDEPQELELPPAALVPLLLALQAAVAAAQTVGIVPVRSPRENTEALLEGRF